MMFEEEVKLAPNRFDTENMILVPAGQFIRGSYDSPDEQPVSLVTMSSFLIDIEPVKNEDFKVFIDNGGYQCDKYWSQLGWDYIKESGIENPNYWFNKNWNQPDQPVTGVSWWEALAYAKFVGKSLPTETQWEYACRGVDQRKYPWGNEDPSQEYANFAVDCDPLDLDRSSTNVRAHPKNISFFGCVDMAGNLAEWCLDNFSKSYRWDDTRQDPLFITEEKDYHIVRGGCGLHNENFLRCSNRDYYPPTLRDNLVGFRCVITLREN